jgi:hypothetical protein
MAYPCAATTSTSLGLGFGNKAKRQSVTTTPAQNGIVSAKGVAVAQTILNGLKDSQGRQAYLSYQTGAEFEEDATTCEIDNWYLGAKHCLELVVNGLVASLNCRMSTTPRP